MVPGLAVLARERSKCSALPKAGRKPEHVRVNRNMGNFEIQHASHIEVEIRSISSRQTTTDCNPLAAIKLNQRWTVVWQERR